MSQPRSSLSPVRVGEPLSLDDLEAVACFGRPVEISAEVTARIASARKPIDHIVALGDRGPAVYGVNTGFGALAETRIAEEHIEELQRNLVRSHACGVGPDLPIEAVRGMMLLRAQVVALGHSGVRVEVVALLVAMLNAGLTPRVPSQGSVGASGDLAPLAHLCLSLIGEGETFVDGVLLPGDEALKKRGLTPVTLAAKEGLALINGTQYMTSIGAIAVKRALALATIADVAGAVSLEALKGTATPFDERLMKVRPHPGQATCAKNLRSLLTESEIMTSHRECAKVQDPYSLRCMPQVHGASRDALEYAARVLTVEMNSVTDNPTVFEHEGGEADLLSGGNFHGQPVALALDLAAIAVAELANISERRVEQLVNPTLSSGLTPFLAKNSGLHSGFMIAQVASASLVSENKVLCHPASVDSIPSSAGREDHVSMGSVSAKKLAEVVRNSTSALAIEILTACQGIEQRRPLTASRGVEAALAAVRTIVPTLEDDRPLYKDIAKVTSLIVEGTIRASVERAIGPLS